MTKIKFYKLTGAGNDFVIIDNREDILDADLNSLAQSLCVRKYGVGADGMMLIEKSKIADFKMRIFNPDGSEVDMCGNGARCIALLANELNIAQKNMRFETLAGIMEAEVISENSVKLKMSDPHSLRLDFDLDIDDQKIKVDFINTGVPHVVLFVDDVDKKKDIVSLGRSIRYHNEFAPDGTNANFVQIEKDKIKIRTYERGVEDETLACGTGSVASAIIAGVKNKLSSPVKVITKGGSELIVYFDISNAQDIKNVCLQGECSLVYAGNIF